MLFNTVACFYKMRLPSLPWTPKSPLPWTDLPLTVLTLHLRDIQIGKPVTISSRMIPRLHTSKDHGLLYCYKSYASFTFYLESRYSKISGGRYSGVVPDMFVIFSNWNEEPKSISFNYLISVSSSVSSTRMLSGLMSEWTIPRLHKTSNASASFLTKVIRICLLEAKA